MDGHDAENDECEAERAHSPQTADFTELLRDHKATETNGVLVLGEDKAKRL